MMLKSTTRHVHIYTATVENNELVPSDDLLTLDVDPDNEFNWSDQALQEVYGEFDRLVDAAEGEDLTDYNLRRIGSDLEHFIRQQLQAGKISYNLKTRALNYSMGLPQVVTAESSDAADSE
ncbi:NAD(P)H-quinone oxidoreductase subunit M [Nodosilinea sp. P-1105]|uniref:NAD(P)H-quinone oxidoreductase subunit M n=1 Tax=Nodosilinea sp. P-1105 TaxID=2546229 RepID=UPI00146ED6D3|nr:NAD(P)H-quinone oxidoreductase subunit M [Nodosilinea sp. P-1105]NMF83976.1 NAD(P)H-quinone oxidoreductase [Nodosilinea sp. P-1105]